MAEQEQGEEISIYNSGLTEKIGIKKVTEIPSCTLNVSDYLRSQIRIEPFACQTCAVIEAPQRIFFSCIGGPRQLWQVAHTAGIASVGRNEPLREDFIRLLGREEQDEFCWITQEGLISARALFYGADTEPVEVNLGAKTVDRPQLLALILNGPHLEQRLRESGYCWDKFSRFTVEIHAEY
ncbi:MAG: hypothetical protein LUD68_03425 [Rikenellaceae bacterium]|nr:hypothetical protein [Rikenellaceae bacterium]